MGVLKFIEKMALVTYVDVLQRVCDDLVPGVKARLEDKDGMVRDIAIHCMGILKGRIPDKVEKYIKDLNK